MMVQAKNAPAKPTAAAPNAKAQSRSCATCLAPLAADVSRCNRCGKQVSGGRKKIDSVVKGRQKCGLCGEERVLKTINFGVLPKGNSMQLLELESAACGICVQASNNVDARGQAIMKAAMIMIGLAFFCFIQWLGAETGGGMYTFGMVGFGMLCGFLALVSRSQHQSSIYMLVKTHPRVIDLNARGGITLMSQADLKKMST